MKSPEGTTNMTPRESQTQKNKANYCIRSLQQHVRAQHKILICIFLVFLFFVSHAESIS